MNKIRLAADSDFNDWLSLRQKLWPHCSKADHEEEMTTWVNDDTKECLVAMNGSAVIGFIEMSLRSVVDGCNTSPVAYVEGWFVDSSFRSKGVGRDLLSAAESWAKDMGRSELGSDAEVENKESIQIHQKLGFEVVDRVVQFKKKIT